MMNKKGQEIGKIITIFPVAILIVIIMALFLVVSLFFSAKSLSDKDKYSIGSDNNFLLKVVTVDNGGVTIHKTIFELYLLYLDGNLGIDVLRTALLSLQNENHECILLYDGSINLGSGGTGDGTYIYPYLNKEIYDKKGLISAFSFYYKSNKIDLQLYYGSCIKYSDYTKEQK